MTRLATSAQFARITAAEERDGARLNLARLLPMHTRVDYSVQCFRDMLTALIGRKAAGGLGARPSIADAMSAARNGSGHAVKAGSLDSGTKQRS